LPSYGPPKLIESRGIEEILPRTPLTLEHKNPQNRSPLFGRGIKRKRTTKGSCIHPPPNPKEKGLEIALRKPPRKGSENHQKERMGTTHPSLEEPHRIILYITKRFIQGLACRPIIHPSHKISP
jgi:hypothetical protein